MVICTIQARMSSSRFPGKILKKLWNGMSVLEFMIRRLRLSKKIDKIVVLTTKNPAEDPICDLCQKLECEFFRGSEHDVMDRMIQGFEFFGIEREDIIVDLTSDTPLNDPKMIDDLLDVYFFEKFDYLGNVITRSYPDGFDIQIYYSNLIKILNKRFINKKHRCHTGWNIINYLALLQMNNNFKIGNESAPLAYFYPEWGLTIDYPEDLELLKKICNHFNSLDFSCGSIIDYLKGNLELLEINKSVQRKIPGEG